MNFQPHRLRAWSRRTRVLAAAGVLTMGMLSVGVMESPAALADPTVHTLVATTESYGPYLASQSGGVAANVYFTISCYVTGDTVTGQYGSENVWDLVSGGPSGYVGIGGFVPDADVYTGSNSPVVPHCSTALGTAIGSNPVNILSGPGSGSALDTLSLGEKIEIECYTTSSTWVSGPYGSENIWDKLPANWEGPMWVPDALIYTGSNSAVVPHC